jgi:hypothetical protein
MQNIFGRASVPCRIVCAMPYENYDAYRRTTADRAFRRALIRRTVTEGIRAIPERIRAQRIPMFRITASRALAATDLPLILVTRDSAHLLPAFLRHYRRLGVTRFIVLDDQSSDETRAILSGCPDVDLWGSSVRYGEAKHGTYWRERLARIYGFGRWYVNVDTDEFLVYDGMERHELRDVCRWLATKRLRRLLAPMLDLYPPGPLGAAALTADRDPWDVATHFDATGYAIEAGRRTTQVFGGPRLRIFAVRAQMVKFPILYWDRRTCFTRGDHAPFPYVRNFGPIAGALLHFKYFSDFRERVGAAVADNQHWHGAAEYRVYEERLRSAGDLVMTGDVSRPYAGVDQLIALGLVGSIDWFDAPGATARANAAGSKVARCAVGSGRRR